jgi:cytochrome o ubiquinol oxidase subunit 3
MSEHRRHIEEAHEDSLTRVGFWFYLMTDLVLFAALFAVFVVLRGSTAGGPGFEIFSFRVVAVETLLLLTSSFTAGLALLFAARNHTRVALWWLCVTLILGVLFLVLEWSEFTSLILSSAGPQQSAFLSSYFTLVGTHGLHVAAGSLWLVSLMVAIQRRGLTRSNSRKLFLWSMFWHFLDLVWICIFSIVYLMSML